MEDEKTTNEELPAPEEKPQDLTEEKFLLKSVVRGRMNRTLRAQQPVHHRLKQYLAGGKYRIIRGRPVVLQRSEVDKYFDELKTKIAGGVFELCTMDGRLVNIDSLEPIKELGPSTPLPNPPLDSIANDQQNVGQLIPQFPGGHVEGQQVDKPDLVAKAETEATEPSEDSLPEGTQPFMEPAEGEESVESNEVPELLGSAPTTVVEVSEEEETAESEESDEEETE